MARLGEYIHSDVDTPTLVDNTANAFLEFPPETLFVLEGNHRRELAKRYGKLGEEFIAKLYRGLSRETMHRKRRALNNKRTIKPAETFLQLVEEGHRGNKEIKSLVEGLGWKVVVERGELGGLACTKELQWIYHRDSTAMIHAIQTYEAVWGRSPYTAMGMVVKGLGEFWLKHPDADPARLAASIGNQTVQELYDSGRDLGKRHKFLKSSYKGVRYTLTISYNDYARAGKLELHV